MLRTSAALSIALLVCAMILETAMAQQAGRTGLHDDTSGRLTEIPIRKENLAFANASAELTFDVDYVYKSSALVGEPLLLCGATLSNPKGTISFSHRDANHQVEVTSQNAQKINPHHLDLLVAYRLPDSRVFYASCDTGIVGSWAREAYNLSTSPSWDRFLCEVAPIVIAHHVSNQPRPNRIGREWCESMQGRYLDAEAAKELFRTRELRASGFVVASLSLDVADLVLDQTRTGLADRIAQRMQAQLEGALAVSKPGMLASSGERETWEALNGEVRARLDAAAATETATERARALRAAIRAVLAAEGSEAGSTETLRAVQQALASRLAAPAEREFAEREREEAGRLQGDRDRIASMVESELRSARAAADAAPKFRFAMEGGKGFENFTKLARSMRIDGRIYSMALSSDGRLAALGLTDRTIRLVDTVSMKEIRALGMERRNKPFPSAVTALAISPDGRLVASADPDWHVRVWNTNGTEIDSFQLPHADRVAWGLDFSSDGRYLASADTSGHVFLWDIQSRWEVWRTVVSNGRDPERYANSVDFTADDRSLIVGTGGGYVTELSTKDGREIQRYETQRGDSVSAFVSDDDRYLALRNVGRGLILLDRQTGDKLQEVAVNGDSSHSGFFTPDLQHVVIASSGRDGLEFFRLNEVAAPSYMRNNVDLPFHSERITGALSGDGSVAAAATIEGHFFILGKER